MSDFEVKLSPPVMQDFWIFERQATDPDAAGTFNWSGYRDIAKLKRRLEDNGLIDANGGCLFVAVGEELAGTVVWTKVTYGKPDWWCWNIGISLLPEFRGRGFGTTAQWLLVSYLFDTLPVERIEAYTDVDNVAEQRSLAKVGFVREGEIRAAQFREGRWRAMALYSMLRDEYCNLLEVRRR
ncbi:GNAT family N-acetyltransferase [Micromonospora sp. SCSIO 07396]